MNKAKLKLTIIIPVFNEAKTVKQVIQRVWRQKQLISEIIVVDDGSTDGSQAILKALAKKGMIKLLLHQNNQGKGAAIKSALKMINDGYVLIQDADLEYDPVDYKKLIKPILEGKAKVVYGSRFTGEHRNMFFWHMLANKILTLLTNVLFDTTLSDMETCYKLLPAEFLKSINLRSKKFDFEPEVTAKILKAGIRIYEVPISYAGREYSEGKKISWLDGLSAFLTLFYYRFFN